MSTAQSNHLWFKPLGDIDTCDGVTTSYLRLFQAELVRDKTIPAGCLVFAQNVGSDAFACVYALYTGDKRTADKYGFQRLSIDWIPPLGV